MRFPHVTSVATAALRFPSRPPDNITAAWAVDREFVYIEFGRLWGDFGLPLAVLGHLWGPFGAPWAPGGPCGVPLGGRPDLGTSRALK